MNKTWPAFIGGIVVALVLTWAAYGHFSSDKNAPATPALPSAPPGAVTITTLPPLFTLAGQEVSFEGRAELPQKLAGRLAGEIVIVAFQASGENAHKSVVRIVWEDGSVENIPAGTKDLKFAPQRRAKQISILGYSFYEQRVFKDVAKRGSLTWQIRYASAE